MFAAKGNQRIDFKMNVPLSARVCNFREVIHKGFPQKMRLQCSSEVFSQMAKLETGKKIRGTPSDYFRLTDVTLSK